MHPHKRLQLFFTSLAILCFSFTSLCVSSALAQKAYDTGATDQEIKIGSIMPITGWAKDYAAVGRAEAAYFQMINDRGGIAGRRIRLVTRDSASQSTNSVELARQLVEKEGVLLVFSTIGTESNLAIRSYTNEKKIPQLFVQTSTSEFDDPAHFPWTMGFFASYRAEAATYGKYILQNRPDAKIAVLYSNDDAGKDYLAGLHAGLGPRASGMIVKELSYLVSGGNIDSQTAALKESGSDVFMNFSIGPFATQSIRRAFDIGWHPLQFIPNASLSISAFLDPAGLPKAEGIISNARSKGWLRPGAGNDPAVGEFLAWMKNYNPDASLRDQNYVAGYERAQALVEVLKRCGDTITRANVMKQAANLDLELGMLRPGIRVHTTPTDYQPIKGLFLIRFDGKEWGPIGPVSGN